MQDREKLCYVDARIGAQGESFEKNLFVGSIIVNGIQFVRSKFKTCRAV